MDLGTLIKPGIFVLSSLGSGILYSLMASESNEYFQDDNTSTSWMSAIFIMAIVFLMVLFTSGCGSPFNISRGGQEMKDRIAVSSVISVVLNAMLAFVYFTSYSNNPNFKRKNFFIFAAVIQFMILVGGIFFWAQMRVNNSGGGGGRRGGGYEGDGPKNPGGLPGF